MEDSSKSTSNNAPAAASEEATATATATVTTADATADTEMAVASPVPVPETQNNGETNTTTATTTPGKAPADPNNPNPNPATTSFGSPTSGGFGSNISPPGMRLRSGKKKKPTPLKSTGKRRRRSGIGIGVGVGINYDSASDYESDTGSMASGVGGSVDDKTKRQRVEKSSSDKDEDQDKDVNMDDSRKNGDTNGNMNGNSTSMMMETIPEQNEVEAAATAAADAQAALEAQRMASEDISATNTNGGGGNDSGSGITPVAVAAASEAARIATTPTNKNILSPPGIQLRLPSQHTPGPASAKTTFVKPQATVSVSASASTSTSKSAYQGTARLRDFTTPAKGGRFAPSPAFSNGASAAGTDSEVERLDLSMPRDHVTEEEEEGDNKDEREEGRRDGLVHAYFKDNGEVDTKTEETSSSSRSRGSGAEGMSVVALCCIALMLHLTLTWMSGSVFRPFFVFSNVPHCADRATVSYGRLFGSSEESSGLEMVVQVEDDDNSNNNDNAIEEEEPIQIPVEQEQEEVEDTVPEPVVEEEDPEPDPEPETIEVEEIVENIVWVDNLELEENERELLKQRRMIEEWNRYKINTSRTKDSIESKIQDIMGGHVAINDELIALEKKFTAKREELTAWQNALDPSLEILDALDSASVKEKFELKGKLNEIFDNLEDSSKVLHDYEALNVLVTDHIRIPGENCLGENLNLEMIADDVPFPVAKPSPKKKKKKKKPKKVSSGVSIADYVTAENVEEAKSDMNEAIVETFAGIRYGTESFSPIDDWLEEQIDMLADSFSLDSGPNLDNIKIEEPDLTKYLEVAHTPAPAPTPVSAPTPNGIALKKVQSIIDGGVEVLKADVTGEHDYASIRAGSKIIKSGPRQTSPSLADNLPLMNQLMGKLGLRFYGNGPHAALEPTYPQDSLGQCWSFEKEGDRKRIMIKELQGDADLEDDPDRGEYATLGVQLAKPIFVKSVVIEHTKKTLSLERRTAIRKFRVIGFQDENADGEPWLLGGFEYNPFSKKYLQEFEVNTTDENGLPIPKLKSIALAVDSNWGADYSCLYRFRVNGSSQRVKN